MTAVCNLAIETSGRIGSVALGRDNVLLASAAMPEQERHRVDLMPTIDRLCAAHGVGPRQIGEVYLSAGPGSFTGLRIGLATAKMLAQVLGAKIVAVPTVEVIACNVDPDVLPPPWHRPSGRSENTHRAEARCHESPPPPELPRVAAGAKRSEGAAGAKRYDDVTGVKQSEGAAWTLMVCLNLKRDTVYAGRFVWDRDRWSLMEEPRLWTAGELLALAAPTLIVGDPLPEAVMAGANTARMPSPGGAPGRIAATLSQVVPTMSGREREFTPGLTILPLQLAQPQSEAVWRLGQAMAQRGEFVDPLALTPIYARQPEAVELWERKLATDGHR
jgi:tRNA threonylcarbamoyl adenosine modification protein YeaZ